jgi:riboflavin kinase
MISTIDKIIHLNDFSFIQLCDKNYGVNRGIYNTIDSWFYENGMENILERRRNIIFFLESIHKKKETKNLRPKFGSGGLTLKLQEYFFYIGCCDLNRSERNG